MNLLANINNSMKKNVDLFQNMVDNKFFKFLVIGGINTIFGYSLYALFIFFHLHYAVATLFSTIIGIFFNFKTIGSIVFKNKNNRLLLKFFIVYGIIYFLNITIMYFLNSLLMNQYFTGAITVLPLAILSFFLNKKYVFTQK
ncbi:hypothetical protein GCM10008018_16060 [Paenibacillus marchantiophytorum]|uniref:GtrA/DPMS transmembrane domain-containing protein n=1 Tax=Paenibacillus marchantiophytorum TaxID=1619310 RepID=A0ABQ2BU30_9BACL|nr:GtrA family protein [Paenibacillus marchantiophytorum]GGI46226.1 hypothetical protein GCM10008018_16060 [Paenibacillus marchantiophytorum]